MTIWRLWLFSGLRQDIKLSKNRDQSQAVENLTIVAGKLSLHFDDCSSTKKHTTRLAQ